MIPTVTVAQMREVDRLMLEEMEISLLQMMENAGRTLAAQARQLLGVDLRGRRIVVLAGRGGNGGGGLAAARRLCNWGADVSVILGQDAGELQEAPAHQLAILRHMPVPIQDPWPGEPARALLESADLIVDALIGYSLLGAPREPIAALIRAAATAGPPILALDIPSGLNADTGEAAEPTIRAAATLTLALPKAGLLQPAASVWVGDVYVADISVPEVVYRRLGLRVGPIFSRADIVRVARDTEAQGLHGS